MDPTTKARIFTEGGKLVSDLARTLINRPTSPRKEAEEKPANTKPYTEQELANFRNIQRKQAKQMADAGTSVREIAQELKVSEVYVKELLYEMPQSVRVQTAGAEETTKELKRRLAKELYRAELDLAAGLKIANHPCDCLSNKHTLMLEAAAEELISQDPANANVYQSIIDWIPANRVKVTPEAIQSGKYAAEYPRMANEFKNFRKQVMGSVGTSESSSGQITLEQAKRMAAEEAAKEVERAWKLEG